MTWLGRSPVAADFRDESQHAERLTAVLRRNYSYFDTAKIAILTRSYFMLENVSYAPDGWF